MDATIVLAGLGTATTLAGLITALFKHARPTASTGAIVLTAVIGGVLSALLVYIALDVSMNSKVIAEIIIEGIFAAATAAGIRQTDNSADAKRAVAATSELLLTPEFEHPGNTAPDGAAV